MISFGLNGRSVQFDGATDTPLLWVLRDHFGLTGTKFGCGIGSCGACTVHVDGRPRKSCATKIASVSDRQVVTIEGLAPSPAQLHPVQQAWIDEDVPQCGYCQAGQIMVAADLLRRNPKPDDAEIAHGMNNICRCGTYPRIRKAVHRAAAVMAGGSDED